MKSTENLRVVSPPVRCAHSELWPTEKLKPHPRNPNRHPPEQLRLLGKVIGATGWRSPIVVSRRSGFVVKGHGRLVAAQMAGFVECPVDIQDYASDAEETADLVADNRLSELAEMSAPDLKALLAELDTAEIDLELAGFSEDALKELTEDASAPDAPASFNYVPQHAVIVTCIGDAEQQATYEKLMALGFACKVVTT